MPQELRERDWTRLIGNIRKGKCTPFIGAGASAGFLPLGGQLARTWAKEYDYPLADTWDLARVAQFLAIEEGAMFPKDELQALIAEAETPDFSRPDEPHAALADLGLPIYITTNYDPYMTRALQTRGRAVRREICRWNRFPDVSGHVSAFDDERYTPRPEEPVVYHLHGYDEMPQSMVLTEADYLDFLIRFSRDQDLLPPAIRMALAGTSLLFVGYSLADWNFRVILRGLVGSLAADLGYRGVAVQLPLTGLNEAERERAQNYMDRYFDEIQRVPVHIYWGDARQFACELRDRYLGTDSCPVEE